MAETPGKETGVGKEQLEETVHTELLDFVAREGLRKVSLLAGNLRRLNQDYPHRTELARDVFFLTQLEAFLNIGLTENGYAETDVNRIRGSSDISPRED